ncbi:hypothetical protein HDV00_000846 [Rhizophlyctis rosea]|nr:hypothetical protein HDV00_000846 [Rhizophlyctis rosea]
MIPYAQKLLELDPLADERGILVPLVEALEGSGDDPAPDSSHIVEITDEDIEQSRLIVKILANRLDYERGSAWCWSKLVEHARRGGVWGDEGVWDGRREWWPVFHFGEGGDGEGDEDLVVSKTILALRVFPSIYPSLNWMQRHNLSEDTLSFGAAGKLREFGVNEEDVFAGGVGAVKRVERAAERRDVAFATDGFEELLRGHEGLRSFLVGSREGGKHGGEEVGESGEGGEGEVGGEEGPVDGELRTGSPVGEEGEEGEEDAGSGVERETDEDDLNGYMDVRERLGSDGGGDAEGVDDRLDGVADEEEEEDDEEDAD